MKCLRCPQTQKDVYRVGDIYQVNDYGRIITGVDKATVVTWWDSAATFEPYNNNPQLLIFN